MCTGISSGGSYSSKQSAARVTTLLKPLATALQQVMQSKLSVRAVTVRRESCTAAVDTAIADACEWYAFPQDELLGMS